MADPTGTLVDRLRDAVGWVERQDTPAPDWDGLLAEAADEIERLRGTSSFEAAYLAGQKALIGMLRVWLTQQDVTTVDQPHTVSHREYRPDADGP